MSALQKILQESRKLNDLRTKNLNDPKVCHEYVSALLELEKAIETFEYEKALEISLKNRDIIKLMDSIMLGMNPQEFSKLLTKVIEELKNAAKVVRKGKQADVFTTRKSILSRALKHKTMKSNLISEINDIQEREAKAREQEGFETRVLKSEILLDLFRQLVTQVNVDFRSIYKLKLKLLQHYEFLAAEDNFYFRENKDLDAAFKQLAVRMQKIDDAVADKFDFIATTLQDMLHAIDHLNRHTTLTRKMKWAFKGGVFDLRKAMEEEFKKQGWTFSRIDSLGIDYTSPWKSFSSEYCTLETDGYFMRDIDQKKVEDIKDIVIRLAQLISREYDHRCDSPYHGVEHMSQVFITSVRIFKGCFKAWQLDAYDFFTLCVSAILHDVGYFVEKFKHSSPAYFSSMYHTYHEQRSAKLAAEYLQHYRQDIMELMGFTKDSEWDGFKGSVQNIISATQLFAGAFRPKKDKQLQEIIRAADLLEMCSENYINYLVPLYIENKIGNPQGPWPKDIDELLKGTPFFMTELEVTKQRTDHMMQYLNHYPQYRQNKDAIVNDLNLYFKALEGTKLTIQEITGQAKRRAA